MSTFLNILGILGPIALICIGFVTWTCDAADPRKRNPSRARNLRVLGVSLMGSGFLILLVLMMATGKHS